MLSLGLPTLDRPLRLLCLGAHSDDIEIGAGGTILRWLEERSDLEIRWVVFSGNAERAHEARASAAAFLENAASQQVDTYAFPDAHFPWVGADIKSAFERIHGEFEPDLVLTHARDDRHQDHRVVSDITWNTFRDALILEYEIPKYDGDLQTPNVYVGLEERIARRKAELLMEYFPTQRTRSWFTEETFLALMRIRGIEAGRNTAYAEGFVGRKVAV